MGRNGWRFRSVGLGQKDSSAVLGLRWFGEMLGRRRHCDSLRNVTASQNKGLAIDDTTFSQCPSLGLTTPGFISGDCRLGGSKCLESRLRGFRRCAEATRPRKTAALSDKPSTLNPKP